MTANGGNGSRVVAFLRTARGDVKDLGPYEMLSVHEADTFIRYIKNTSHEVLIENGSMEKDFIDYWKPIYSSMRINKLKRRLKV